MKYVFGKYKTSEREREREREIERARESWGLNEL